MIDLHCHILPDMDDGAKSMQDSLAMLRIASLDGVTQVFATPHVFRGSDSLGMIKEIHGKVHELNLAAKDAGIIVELLPGAEVHITHDLIEKITSHRENLTLNGSSYILIEFPSDHIYPRIKEHFYNLISQGIKPIIAHPERNLVLSRHPEMLYELVSQGVRTQANAGSFIGLYGEKVRITINKFLRWNLIHFIGSDGHNLHSLLPKLSDAYAWVSETYGFEGAEALFQNNPLAVAQDRDLPFSPDPIDPRPKRRSLKIKLPHFSGADHQKIYK